MDYEEVRIRSLVHLRTKNKSVISNIPPSMAFAGLYPETIGLGDELYSFDFHKKVEQLPDVKRALIEANMWYGEKPTTTNHIDLEFIDM